MATRKRAQATAADADADPGTDRSVKAIRHPSKRKNISPAGLEAQGRVEEMPKVRHEYNPHLPTRLRFADDPAAADRLPQLLATARERALSADEAALLADALRRHEPWLEWSGKRERPWFEVEPPALRIHERVIAQAMLRVLAREDLNRPVCRPAAKSCRSGAVLQVRRGLGRPHDPGRQLGRDGQPGAARGPGIDPRGNEGLRVLTMAPA